MITQNIFNAGIATLVSSLFCCACITGAAAADWGYDDGSAAQNKPLRAQALPLHEAAPKGARPVSPFARGTAGGVTVKTPAMVAKPSAAPVAADKQPLVVESWKAVYELAGGQNLDGEQQKQLTSLFTRKLGGSPAERKAAESVLAFWPQLSAYLVANPQQRPNYAALLKALLRYQARAHVEQSGGAKTEGALAEDEDALIAQVLGAQMMSVAGTVPFSEDAVNAYADMACFIYEQRNPGKSVDAEDNRALFATVVSEKFKAAPSRKDKEAMAGFDLVWAKFRIVWTQADEKRKAALLDSLAKAGAGAALASSHDSLLELVLSHWPMPEAKDVSAASTASADPHK